MTLQEDFDALSADYHALKKEWETAKQNLLSGALITPGTLRFGGDTMQLGQQGTQVRANGSSNIAIYFVDKFYPVVNNTVPFGYLYGAVFPDQTPTWGHATIQMGSDAVKGDQTSSASGYYQTQAEYSGNDLIAFGAYVSSSFSPGGYGGYLASRTTSTGTVQNMSVGTVFSIGSSTGDNAPLWLIGADNDPDSLSDGMIWYRSDLDVIRARINGATVTIAPISASILTDTAWANKGDIVVATANDTAQIVSVGQDGYVLKADSTQTPGVKWKGMLEVSNQTGTYNAVQGEYVRCSGTFTVTLPNASANDYIVVGNVGTGVITINTTGGATFDYYSTGMASGTITILPGERLQFLFYTTGSWQVF